MTTMAQPYLERGDFAVKLLSAEVQSFMLVFPQRNLAARDHDRAPVGQNVGYTLGET